LKSAKKSRQNRADSNFFTASLRRRASALKLLQRYLGKQTSYFPDKG